MKLKNILLVVKDIDKSVAFYKDLFGLEVILRSDGNVIMTEGLVLQECNIWKELVNKDPNYKNNASVLYFEEYNLEAFQEKLDKSDYQIEYVNRLIPYSWEQKAIRIYDLDGHLIEIGECN